MKHLDLTKPSSEVLLLEGTEQTGTFVGLNYDSLITLIDSRSDVEEGVRPIFEQVIFPKLNSYVSSHAPEEMWQTFSNFKDLHQNYKFKSSSLWTLLKPLIPVLKYMG